VLCTFIIALRAVQWPSAFNAAARDIATARGKDVTQRRKAAKCRPSQLPSIQSVQIRSIGVPSKESVLIRLIRTIGVPSNQQSVQICKILTIGVPPNHHQNFFRVGLTPISIVFSYICSRYN